MPKKRGGGYGGKHGWTGPPQPEFRQQNPRGSVYSRLGSRPADVQDAGLIDARALIAVRRQWSQQHDDAVYAPEQDTMLLQPALPRGRLPPGRYRVQESDEDMEPPDYDAVGIPGATNEDFPDMDDEYNGHQPIPSGIVSRHGNTALSNFENEAFFIMVT